MSNLVKAARNVIEFIEQNGVADKYEDEYTEDGQQSQGQRLKELVEELNEATDASTKLGCMGHAQILIDNYVDNMITLARQIKQP